MDISGMERLLKAQRVFKEMGKILARIPIPQAKAVAASAAAASMAASQIVPFFVWDDGIPKKDVDPPLPPHYEITPEAIEYVAESGITANPVFYTNDQEYDEYVGGGRGPAVDESRETLIRRNQPDPVPVGVKAGKLEQVIVTAERVHDGYQLSIEGNPNPIGRIYGNDLREQQPHIVFPNIAEYKNIDELMKTLPRTLPHLRLQVNPETQGKVSLKIVVRTQVKTRLEENTRRQDTKHKGMMLYIALLHLVNRTWGRVTELVDFWNVFAQSIRFDRQITIYDAERGFPFTIKEGMLLSELGPAYQAEALKAMTGRNKEDWSFNSESFIKGMLAEAVTDAAIGYSKQYERKALNEIGGFKNTQNVSTMVNRGLNEINAYFNAKG